MTAADPDPDRLARREVDARFFGLEPVGEDAGHTRFVVSSHLSRPDRRLYGGTAIGITLAAIERATDREPVWATTQFSSTAETDTVVDCRAEVLAAGRRASQVRITATTADTGAIVFVALGAAVEPKRGGLTGSPEPMPQARPPDEGRPAFERSRIPWDERIGWHLAVDMRTTAIDDHHDDVAGGRMAMWSRIKDDDPWTPGRLAYVADMVPVSIARSLGVTGAGTSLDNTLRIGGMVDTGWVLIDLRPHLAHAGYGHGTVHLWAEDGTLLATGSQTAGMLIFDRDPLAGGPPPPRRD